MSKILIQNMADAKKAVRFSEKMLKQAKENLQGCEEDLFFYMTDKKYLIGSIISMGTDFEYKILSVGIDIFYPSETKEHNPYVNAIRVKKGTNTVIDGKFDSIAYANKFYTYQIKKVLR